MNISLKDKIIVVTGASRGIGRELSIALAQQGATVIATYNKSVDKGLEVERILKSYTPDSVSLKVDLTDEEQVKRFYQTVNRQFGRVDVLFNNAGCCKDALCPVMSSNSWDTVIKTNMYSVFYCCKYFSKTMILQKQGKIFNIASYKGIAGCKGQTNYSASKAGVIAFTKSLARELASFGIIVNSVCPGFIITSLNEKSEMKIAAARNQSLLPIDNNLQTLINSLVFLSSDLFQNVTGQTFSFDSRIT